MSKKRKLKQNKNKSEDFQTGFTKSDWYGSGRRNRTKRNSKNKKSYKKFEPKSIAGMQAETVSKEPESAVNSPVSGLKPPAKPVIVPE